MDQQSDTNPKLKSLRHRMAELGLTAYVIFHDDAHSVSSTLPGLIIGCSQSTWPHVKRESDSSVDSVGAMPFAWSHKRKRYCGPMAGTIYRLRSNWSKAGRCANGRVVSPLTSSGSGITCLKEAQSEWIRAKSELVTNILVVD